MVQANEKNSLSPRRSDRSFEIDYDLYAEVANAAELREIRLVSSAFSMKPEILRAIEDYASMKHGFVGDCGSLTYDAADGFLLGHYNWTAEIKSGRTKALKLTCDYLVSYDNLVEKDEPHVSFFFHKVGRFATYPYFRALFSHHSAESGLVLPPLPTLNERVD